MRRYSQFLTSNPTFLGLNPYDLFVLAISMQCSLIFNCSALFIFIFCPLAIVVGKLIQKYLDVTGFLLGFRRKGTLSLNELLKKQQETRK